MVKRALGLGWALWLLLAPTAANAARLAVEVDLPDAPTGGRLDYGVHVAGHQRLDGSLQFAQLASESGPAGGTPAKRLTIDIDLGNIADAVTARLYLCLDRDGLTSYVPSFGDLYQIIDVPTGATSPVRVERDGWQELTPAIADRWLTVHYHRHERDYDQVGLWTWDERLARAPVANELWPVGRDAFGVVFQIDIGLYGAEGDGIGLLPRRFADWQHKDGGDRMWRPSLGDEVFLVQADNRVYPEEPDVSPKVRRVAIDADKHLTVRFSHRLPIAEWTPARFKLLDSAGEALPITAVYPFKHQGDRCAIYSLEVSQSFEYPQKAYALEIDGFGTKNVVMGHLVKDPERYFDADAAMGASYTPAGTTFRVFAPGAMTAWVVVAEQVAGGPAEDYPMTISEKGIWSVTVPCDLAGKYYAYRLGGLDFDAAEEIVDIYATCTQARHRRSLIVDLRTTDPPGFRDHRFTGSPPFVPAGSPTDAIIYEMHVRDFTIAANSGVQRKGKYLGLAESGTTLPDDPSIRTGLDHLVELGVTHVQLMPVQDFDNHEHEQDSYNWGYMPVHFNAPDGWFALDPMGPGKITELKSAIQALHQRGIGVVLDVVYNHTADWASFEKLVPGYYFRLTDAGNFSNGSGCGNEFASENPMARKFILDSLRFWVEEYKVDGFRFDLMGLIDLETMKQIRARLAEIHPQILVYGEPWTGGPTPLKPITDKNHTRGTGLIAFNDHYRDAIKGGRDGGAPGFIQAGGDVDKVVKGLMGAIHDWAQDPVDTINYFEAHDNLTAWDKLLQSVPHGSDEVRRRMIRLAALSLFSAQGMVFLHSGQEMCRSKQGNHNSYNAPDDINEIDWSLKKTYADVVAYHRGLIALRKAHPALRLRHRGDVEERVHFHAPPDPRTVVYEVDGVGVEGESARRILVLLNGGSDTVTVQLPDGTWQVHADGREASLSPLRELSGATLLVPHAGMMLLDE